MVLKSSSAFIFLAAFYWFWIYYRHYPICITEYSICISVWNVIFICICIFEYGIMYLSTFLPFGICVSVNVKCVMLVSYATAFTIAIGSAPVVFVISNYRCFSIGRGKIVDAIAVAAAIRYCDTNIRSLNVVICFEFLHVRARTYTYTYITNNSYHKYLILFNIVLILLNVILI